MKRTRKCKNIERTDQCRYGNKCWFNHDEKNKSSQRGKDEKDKEKESKQRKSVNEDQNENQIITTVSRKIEETTTEQLSEKEKMSFLWEKMGQIMLQMLK